MRKVFKKTKGQNLTEAFKINIVPGIALIVVNSVNQALLIKGISLIPTLIQNNLDESLIKCHSINCNLDEYVSFQIESLARERWRKIIKSRKVSKAS